MKKLVFTFLFALALCFSLQAQLFIPGHVLSMIPFTPCVGSPVSFTAIDTSGQYTQAFHSWNFGDGSTGWGYSSQPTVTHTFTAPGTYEIHFSAYDSLSNAWDADSFMVTVDSICANHDNISGLVYYDANGNGAQDPGEPGFPNRTLEITPGPYYITSDANGMFSVNLTPGTYGFAVINNPYYTVTQPSGGSYTVTSAGNGSLHPNNDFGLYPTAGINDLRVYQYSAPPVPGFNRYISVYYSNVGTTVQNATVTLQLDPAVTFLSASSGGTYNAGTVTWNVNGLFPGTSGYLDATVNVNLGTPLGSSIIHTSTISPVAGDATPANNVDSDTLIVVASYDPNDKTPTPAGQGPSGDIAPGTPISYTVRFQNTGTFYATDVIIRDSLDADLDQSTLEVLGSSHPMTWHNDFGKLAFEFRNIMLPDSNTNEPASHGFVSYRITPKSTLPLGTELTNTASIYFDFNAPVVTNTTLNTLSNVVAVDPASNPNHLQVAPNPFGDQVRFVWENASSSDQLILRDLSGRIVRTMEGLASGSVTLDASDLPAGLYLFTLQNEKGVQATGKIVRQ